MDTGTHTIEETPAEQPIELELGDGSRLVLDDAAASPVLRRIEGGEGRISLDDAMRMPGQAFAGYRHLKN